MERTGLVAHWKTMDLAPGPDGLITYCGIYGLAYKFPWNFFLATKKKKMLHSLTYVVCVPFTWKFDLLPSALFPSLIFIFVTCSWNLMEREFCHNYGIAFFILLKLRRKSKQCNVKFRSTKGRR